MAREVLDIGGKVYGTRKQRDKKTKCKNTQNDTKTQTKKKGVKGKKTQKKISIKYGCFVCVFV